MIFKTTTDRLVRIPDDRLCLSICDDPPEYEVWEAGDYENGYYAVTRETAFSIAQKLGDSEAE